MQWLGVTVGWTVDFKGLGDYDCEKGRWAGIDSEGVWSWDDEWLGGIWVITPTIVDRSALIPIDAIVDMITSARA